MGIGDVLTIVAPGVASFVAPAAPAGQPVFFTLPGTAVKGGVALVQDVDLTAYLDKTVIIEARVIGTTKNATPHLVDSAVMPAFAVFNNKNGTVSLGTAAAGGSANPFQSTPQFIPAYPETTDGLLRSGGFAAWTATWTAPGGALARLTIVNSSPTNDGDVLTYFTIYPKAA